MNVPLTLAVPATVASLAYLRARTSFPSDWNILSAFTGGSIKWALRSRRDKSNLFYLLEEHAQSQELANRTFFLFQGQEWTYRQTHETALRYGQWLKLTFGVKPKDIVAMDMINSHHFVFLFLGLWSIGASPAFINYNLTGNALVHTVKKSTARVLIVDEELRSVIAAETLSEIESGTTTGTGAASVTVAFFTPQLEADALAMDPIREPDSSRAGVLPHDIAALIYTSGTTGLPKPAIVSWRKVTWGASFVYRWLGWTTNDRMYTCMPLYHSTAMIVGFCPALHAGGSIAIGRRFSTKGFWKEVRETKSNMIQYVGETCRYLLAAPPEIDPVTGEDIDKNNGVRLAFGNGLRPDVWDKFKTRFAIETIAEFYGATEAPLALWNLSRNDFSRGAIGRNGALLQKLMGARMTLVRVDWDTEMPWRDPETGFCKKVAHGEPGELICNVDPANIAEAFQGYLGNPKGNESKILRDVFRKGDAYFRTGDVLKFDKEGRWYFSDRLGDTFRWKSENVSTSEVSEALGLHPLVSEANVYGVSLPHHDGNAGMAALVLTSPASPSPDLLRSLAAHATHHLPHYAVPLFLRVQKHTQATGNNKQQKVGLRQKGVDPARADGDELYWLRRGEYVPFGQADWEALQKARVRL